MTPDEIDERIGVLRQRRRAASNEITRQMRRGNELLRLAAIARRDRDEIDGEIQKLESQKVKGKRQKRSSYERTQVDIDDQGKPAVASAV